MYGRCPMSISDSHSHYSLCVSLILINRHKLFIMLVERLAHHYSLHSLTIKMRDYNDKTYYLIRHSERCKVDRYFRYDFIHLQDFGLELRQANKYSMHCDY